MLLARAFRSILLPLKAVVLNVLSVAASWGVITLVWQKGYGSELLFGIPPTDAITTWVPLAVFAFLYGLSMDYEVFILARVRESYDATGSTRDAVIGGLGRTGRLVTSAALILFLAFVALAATPSTEIKVLATGLGGGHPARRHGDPRARRARPGDAVRALELVAGTALGAAAQNHSFLLTQNRVKSTTVGTTRPPTPNRRKSFLVLMFATSQSKFWPKKPVTSVHARKSVPAIVIRVADGVEAVGVGVEVGAGQGEEVLVLALELACNLARWSATSRRYSRAPCG